MDGVAILGGTSPPSWRRMREGCMVVVVVFVPLLAGTPATWCLCGANTRRSPSFTYIIWSRAYWALLTSPICLSWYTDRHSSIYSDKIFIDSIR